LKPGSRFVDIGASFGHYTSLASRIVGPAGEVFAFEPSPIPSASIERFIATNAIKNIELVRAAVGESQGEIVIYLPGNDAVVHSPSAFASDPTFTELKVDMISLDTFAPLNDGQPIDLMKIDVEGFEPNVVAGMKQMARSGTIRNVMCEFNTGWLRRNHGASADSLFESISDLGFRVVDRTEKEVHLENDGKTHYHLQDILFEMPRRT
jgi:FkbM family methyltransferase